MGERSLSGHKSTHLHTHNTKSEAEVKNNVEGEATAEELKAAKRPAEDSETDPKKQKTDANGKHEEVDDGEEDVDDEDEDEEELEGEDDEDIDGEDEEGEEGEDEEGEE